MSGPAFYKTSYVTTATYFYFLTIVVCQYFHENSGYNIYVTLHHKYFSYTIHFMLSYTRVINRRTSQTHVIFLKIHDITTKTTNGRLWDVKAKDKSSKSFRLGFKFNLSDRNIQAVMICVMTNLRSEEVCISPRLGFEVSF